MGGLSPRFWCSAHKRFSACRCEAVTVSLQGRHSSVREWSQPACSGPNTASPGLRQRRKTTGVIDDRGRLRHERALASRELRYDTLNYRYYFLILGPLVGRHIATPWFRVPIAGGESSRQMVDAVQIMVDAVQITKR